MPLLAVCAARPLLLLLLLLRGASAGRVALLIKGESFKVNSHQRGRETGAAGLAHQRLASLSQLLFAAQPLVFDAGYEAVDIYVDTYTTGLEEHLARWYAPYGKVTLHAPDSDLRGSKTDNCLAVLAPDSPYEAALFLRPDMVLKPLFGAALAAANRSKLLFSFREWRNEDGYPEWPGVPRVADMVMWTPRWAFATVRSRRCRRRRARASSHLLKSSPFSAQVRDDPPGFINNHNAVWVANQRYNVSVANTGFLLPTEQYDADPAKSGNPLYTLAQRPEKPINRPDVQDRFPETVFDGVMDIAARGPLGLAAQPER